jgi:GWxTD domain-containing protein
VRRPVYTAAVLLLPVVAACGTWKRVGTPEPRSATPEQVTRLFDPTTTFREMGLIAVGGALPIVGSVRLLAGPAADSTLVLVSLSLHNRGLTFRRAGDGFAAGYRVEVVFRQGNDIAQQVVRDERVQVGSFRETLRTEESIIFQQFVPVRVGDYVIDITVRDRGGPNVARSEVTAHVPGLEPPAVSHPIAVYEARPRTSTSAPPTLVANPRNAVAYGADSVRFYLETYGLPAGTALAMEVEDPTGRSVWVDTARIESTAPVAGRVITIPPSQLSLGRHELKVGIVTGGVVATASFLVAFSDFWAISNFDDMISLLRYFAPADTLRALNNAPADQRAAAWQHFWIETDPNPLTPENEALDQYFARLQAANQRFTDEGIPGWLTERGEVLITIGEPDQVYDPRPDIQGRGRVFTWIYNQYRLQLYFVDDAGFGRFRLDPRSRSDYLVVLNRLRRQQ